MTLFDIWFHLSRPTTFLIERFFERYEGQWACPVCGVNLVKGQQRRFETLDEHVTDPNKEEYPLRDAWVCPTETCKVHTTNSFFADMGGLFTGREGINAGIPNEAIFSWDWVYQQKQSFWKSRLGKVLAFPANKILMPFCWLGLHFPHGRVREEWGSYCGLCHKDLENPIYKKHPLFQSCIEWQEERHLPLYRRILRSIV